MMITSPMSRDQIAARLVSYGIRCVAAAGLVLVILFSQAATQ
jgi:hypothetical protein